nr:hypothetical protein [uncultured Dysosmobacter sp.]
MTLDRAIRLARVWAFGGVCTLQDGEAQEYHRMALTALKFQLDGAVQPVRCRECKWFNADTMECECDDVATDHEGGASFSINFGPDDFCSYGERKDGDG